MPSLRDFGRSWFASPGLTSRAFSLRPCGAEFLKRCATLSFICKIGAPHDSREYAKLTHYPTLPRLRSGFRQAAQTPLKRLNFDYVRLRLTPLRMTFLIKERLSQCSSLAAESEIGVGGRLHPALQGRMSGLALGSVFDYGIADKIASALHLLSHRGTWKKQTGQRQP